MPNKKPLIILLTLLIIILAIFSVIYLVSKKEAKEAPVIKIPVKQIQEENKEKDIVKEEKEIKPLEIFPLKEVILSTDKQTYNSGEEIKVMAMVKNPFPKTKKWQVVYYFMSEDEKSFSALGQVKELEMKPGQTEKVEFTSKVGQNLPPGNYKIKLEVLEQEQIINSKSRIIKIQGTNKILSADIQSCEDIDCQIEKSVFLKNKTVFIKINSDVSNLEILGKIKYPNQEEAQDLNFKNSIAQIRASQIGSYEAIIYIKKDGYQSVSVKKDFAVIKELPEIK